MLRACRRGFQHLRNTSKTAFRASASQPFLRASSRFGLASVPLTAAAYLAYSTQTNVTEAAPANILYPPIEPYQSGYLKVDDTHTIYYEQCGNPDGMPVVFLHGGPGGGINDSYRQYFDPEFYRIILFDQRGAGKSTPHACLKDNTTWHLVDDIEKLRKHLDVRKWMVFGGSWGSTLSLSYAETHPGRVVALMLRGIFTLRRDELLWFYQKGASHIFPDAWDQYLAAIPEVEHGDLMSAYHRRLTSDDLEEQMAAAKAWTKWEMSTSKLVVDPAYVDKAASDSFALAFARIESHFFVNGGFFKEDGQLIKNADILKDIPGVIVQGRYDVVCPAVSAWDLHKAWPQSELIIVQTSGHSMGEVGISKELVAATDRYRSKHLWR